LQRGAAGGTPGRIQRAADELPGTRDSPAGGGVHSAAGDGTHALSARLQWGDRGDLTAVGESVSVVADPVPAS
jgi:hypothetical protein